eukprot:TRINITY_DN3794_c0_g1_i2.p1 TRINITY_DN3794_c0_g1~~TRINITY_DN3794_c0_g1_i2.p1  ORF type:complete len:525 (-),score=87.76 TRINITY_DN3794_c0_g1_i2:25-1599(-)
MVELFEVSRSTKIAIVFFVLFSVLIGIEYFEEKGPCDPRPARFLSPQRTGRVHEFHKRVQVPLLPPAHSEYSSHWCVGGVPQELYISGAHDLAPPYPEDPRRRTCIFRNICYQNGDYLYYGNPQTVVPWEHKARTDPVYHPPTGAASLVSLNSDLWWRSAVSPANRRYGFFRGNMWTPKFKFNQTIPEEAVFTASEGLTVVYAPNLPWNFGVTLGDDLLSLYIVAQTWGLLDMPISLITTESCESLEPDGLGRVERCRRLQNKVLALLSDQEPLHAAHDTLASATSRPVCWPLLLVGLPPHGYHNDLNHKADHFSQFRDWVLRKVDVTCGHAPTPLTGDTPVITLVKASGVLRFENHDELLAHLTQKYTQFKVVELSPDALSMRDEVLAMQRTTILIAPPGAAGFGAFFLPNAAAAIFGAYCTYCELNVVDNTTVCCRRMDNHLWSFVPYFQSFHYLPRNGNVQFGPSNETYAVDLALMDRYVAQAMEATGIATDVWTVSPQTHFVQAQPIVAERKQSVASRLT